jgi:ferritin-like metal-binding protein YciE
MPAQSKRDAKLVQYLNDAYVIERRLEGALETHIDATTRPDYLKRLKQHLKETKSHATEVDRRIRQLGGQAELVRGPDALGRGAEAAQSAVQRATAAVRKPLEAVKGTGEQERMLKNARTEFEDEAKEIANYRVIEAMATAVGDTDTAKLARKILRQEQRMSEFLAGLIPELAANTAHDEIPIAEIDAPSARRTPAAASAGNGEAKTTRAKTTRAKTTRAKATRAKPRARTTAAKPRATSRRSRSS